MKTPFALLALLAPCAALYKDGGDVVVSGHATFGKDVLKSRQAALVEFYAPWCGYCQQLKPAYEKTAKALKGIAKVVAVDCNEERNRGLCAKYEVQGFPTVKLFEPKKKAKKRFDKRVTSYDGPRTAQAMTKHVLANLHHNVTRLSKPNAVRRFVGDDVAVPRVVLVSTRAQIPPLFKTLSLDFSGYLQFGFVGPDLAVREHVINDWNLQNSAAQNASLMIVFAAGSQTPERYEGSLKKYISQTRRAAKRASRITDEL